jgi:ABC-type transport system involved in cytochrome bd biosynthesis fused ATPase/permease subunit
MNDCLNGYLKNKTRILITHALHNLTYVDYVYLLENG